MRKAKLFKNGNSQAVRLPKAFRLPGNEVRVYRDGNKIVLEPMEKTWDVLFEALEEFPDDFMEGGRAQPKIQQRESL